MEVLRIMLIANTLLKKAFRDLWRSRALFISVIALLTLGVGIFVTMYSAFLNVKASEDFAYEELKFADAFYVIAPPIPVRAADVIRGMDGVAAAEGRYVADIAIRQPDDRDTTLSARVISIPDDETPEINRVIVREGGYIEAADGRQALVDRLFTEYYGLQPGDSVSLVYQGKDRDFEISGAITHPEYIWKSKGGAELITSPGDFAIVMVRRNAIDDMLGVEGLINEITVRFRPGADTAAAKAEIDAYLDRYGSHHLIEKEDQLSYATLKSDLDGFAEMAVAMPVLFLCITAMVAFAMLARIVQSQRHIIGLMRAEGFSRLRLLRHYLTFPILIAFIGSGLGILWGTIRGGRLHQPVYRDARPALHRGRQPDMGTGRRLHHRFDGVRHSGHAACAGSRKPNALGSHALGHIIRRGVGIIGEAAANAATTRYAATRIAKHDARTLANRILDCSHSRFSRYGDGGDGYAGHHEQRLRRAVQRDTETRPQGGVHAGH